MHVVSVFFGLIFLSNLTVVIISSDDFVVAGSRSRLPCCLLLFAVVDYCNHFLHLMVLFKMTVLFIFFDVDIIVLVDWCHYSIWWIGVVGFFCFSMLFCCIRSTIVISFHHLCWDRQLQLALSLMLSFVMVDCCNRSFSIWLILLVVLAMEFNTPLCFLCLCLYFKAVKTNLKNIYFVKKQ